jgi:hypothetical protein
LSWTTWSSSLPPRRTTRTTQSSRSSRKIDADDPVKLSFSEETDADDPVELSLFEKIDAATRSSSFSRE